jgi:sarcosine oxidase subunit gamma
VTADAPARDPLSARAADLERIAEITGGEVTLAHVPFLVQVDVRVDPAALAGAPALPAEPNTVLDEGSRAVLWLGPDEWLVLETPGDGTGLIASLSAALAGTHHSVVDVGANRVALELGGPGRLDLLARGCSLDLHPRAWRAGMCAQTMLAKAQVVLQERPGSTRVLVRPSFAGYLVDWMLAATGG